MRRTGAALSLLLACACGPPDAGPPERIVLIVVDTLRRDHIGAYGGGVATPHVDALAERGTAFRNVLASFHQTSMSMASLFTGRTPSLELLEQQPLFWNSTTWCGMHRFAAPGDEDCIPASLPSLASRLRDAGYETLGVTSNQFLYEPSGFSRGFDTWVEVGDHPENPKAFRMDLEHPERSRWRGPVNRAAVRVVNGRRSDRFFLYVHYMDVHDYALSGTTYADAVRAVDDSVGKLLGGLEAAGLLAGSVVIFTADHGERLGERHPLRGTPGHSGNPSFMELLRIPLIVAPSPPPPDDDPDAFLRTRDVHGLILRLAGAAAPAPPELADGELFLSELKFRTHLDGRFKATIRREDDRLFLFDLERDPGETRDVAAAHPEAARRARERVLALSSALSARDAVVEKLSPEDRERLRVLGYLDALTGADE